MKEFICRYCGKECINANSLRNHERLCKENLNRQILHVRDNLYSYRQKVKNGEVKYHSIGRICINNGINIKYIKQENLEEYLNSGWNIGVTDSFKEKTREANNKRKFPGKANDKDSEEKRKQKISNTMKNNPKSGGYRMNSGRGKKGWYKGIFCDSSWELAFVIWNIENNKHIERCKEKREYIFKGEKHIYIPDFIVEDEVIEIKGYSSKQWEEKIKQNPDVKVLYKNDIKPYLDYVISKYGKNFISLYEK
jgi:hypothetical protein